MNKHVRTLCTIALVLLLGACKKDSNQPDNPPGWLLLKVGSYEEKHQSPTFEKRQRSATTNAYEFNSQPGSKYVVLITLDADNLQANHTYTIDKKGGKFLYQFSSSHALDAPNNGYLNVTFTSISAGKANGTITGELKETGNTYPVTGSFENMVIE